MTTSLPMLPAGITCPDWQAREAGKKRCAFYMPPDTAKGEMGALCNLPTHFLCTEWEKANPAILAQARAAAPPEKIEQLKARLAAEAKPEAVIFEAPGSPPRVIGHVIGTPSPTEVARAAGVLAPLQLFPTPAPAPRAPIGQVADSPSRPPARENAPAPAGVHRPVREIPVADLEALERLGVEVCLGAPALDREVWLVARKTGRADRFELSFREAATLRLLVDSFPGARVTAIRDAEKGPLP